MSGPCARLWPRVLLDLRGPVLHLEAGLGAGAEHPGAEGRLAVAQDAVLEEQLQPLRAAQVELVTDDRLEEGAAVGWAVEDLGAADLELHDAQLVAVAGLDVGLGERGRQDRQPPPDEALDGRGGEAVAGLLQDPSIVDRGEAVVEGLVAEMAILQPTPRPVVAVRPYAHAPGGIGADLDEGRAHVAVPQVQVDVVDVRAQPADRVAPGLALPLGGRAEHLGPLLGDADEHDPLAPLALGGLEVRAGHVLLAHALLEANQRDASRLRQALHLAPELGRPPAEDGVARDLLARLALQEAGQALGRLEPGHVAVQEQPVDALVAQRDVLIERVLTSAIAVLLVRGWTAHSGSASRWRQAFVRV